MSQSLSSSGDGEGECSICKSKYLDNYDMCNGKAGIDCGNIQEEVKCYCRDLNSPALAASS